MSELIIDKVRGFIESLLPSLGLELFEVQFRREGHGWVLRVFVESDAGVTLDNCTDVSRELSRYLDVEDFIDHEYHLEVSSPGLERPLRSVEEFQRFCGRKTKVRLHDALDGEKTFEGKLDKVIDGQVYLLLEDGQLVQFSFEQVNKARLAI